MKLEYIKEKTTVSSFNDLIRLGIFIVVFSVSLATYSQVQMETINRGVVAVQKSASSVYVGWRLFGTEDDSLGFNLYRITDGAAAIKINPEVLSGATNYLDTTDIEGSTHQYYVVPVENEVELEPSDTVDVWAQNYLSVPIQVPSGGTTPEGSYTYSANDASVGDLDGDGEYEIVLKWDPSNSKDNSQSGYTGNCILDAYKMDGTLLWRIDLGINIRSGAHYTQFMVYDLDGDGKAEVACKTAPGSKDASGSYLSLGPAASDDDEADYRNSSGYILEGPEYLTIFNGEDGTELVTTDYIPARGVVSSWGDNYGNRVDRFLAAIAYLDGEKPSLVMCRGYYTRTVLAAWDWREGTLTQRWVFDTDEDYSSYAGQGNHQISVADVDDDGRDEIIYGAMAVDDDGTGLWNTGLGHGDAMHVSDILPERDGLEKWGIFEGSGPGSALLDARTGEILWKTADGDVGRGVSADLHPDYLGMECWGGTDGLRSANNIRVGDAPSSANHVCWWDGDLSRELLNGTSITKYGGGTLLSASGCSSNNGSKSNPSLQADLFGDWREEVIWRTSDNNYLRIYTTTDTTQYRIKTLMHDRVYRLGIAWQNVGYNQPPHTGFYLGNDMFTPDSLLAPSMPSGLELGSTIDFIQLNWISNFESDLAGYKIYRSDSADGTYVLINDSLVTGTSYRDSSVVIDIQYYYKISAVDTLENESALSAYVVGASTLKPDWPIGIKTTYGPGRAYVYWDPHENPDVIGYNIYRSETSGVDYEKLNGTTLLTDEFYSEGSLTNGYTYYYVVTALDNMGRESFYSDEVAVTPSDDVILQAEDFEWKDVLIESEHIGYNGTGYVNFGSDNTYVEFQGVFAINAGWYYLVYRYALGNTDRTGSLIVNDSVYTLTMHNTDEWTNYVTDTVKIKMNSGFDNVIRFETTGSDFGNLDQIQVGDRTTAPEPPVATNMLTQVESKVTIAPNPFNRQALITVSLEQPAYVNIDILNSLGQKVASLATNQKVTGKYQVIWDGTDNIGNKINNGIYFCRVITDNQLIEVKRILFIE